VSREAAIHSERWFYDLGLRRAAFSIAQANRWACGVLAGVHQRLCAMRGHDLVLHFEPHRVSLRCVDCGWDSSGWLIDRPRFGPSQSIDRRPAQEQTASVTLGSRRRTGRAPRRPGSTCAHDSRL
jgi:hypothetical protein